MSVMRVIVFHPYTKYEVCRPFRSEDIVIFGHSDKRPADLDL